MISPTHLHGRWQHRFLCAGRISVVPALAAAVPAIGLDGADHDLDGQHHPNLSTFGICARLVVQWLVPGWIMLLEYGSVAAAMPSSILAVSGGLQIGIPMRVRPHERAMNMTNRVCYIMHQSPGRGSTAGRAILPTEERLP